MAIHHLRPYKIFTLLDGPPSSRVVNVPLPSRRGMGGTSLLETFLILAAIRIVDARRIFEFGTFRGSNTLNMALNTPDDAEIFSLDLDQRSASGLEQHPDDAPLTEVHLNCGSALDFSGASVERKIQILTGDSTKFNFSSWQGSIDLAFIDGGHDYLTVKSDTENALGMAAEDRPSCVVWHDYRNWIYPSLTCYLDSLAHDREIFHIEDTMLCMWFNKLWSQTHNLNLSQ